MGDVGKVIAAAASLALTHDGWSERGGHPEREHESVGAVVKRQDGVVCRSRARMVGAALERQGRGGTAGGGGTAWGGGRLTGGVMPGSRSS